MEEPMPPMPPIDDMGNNPDEMGGEMPPMDGGMEGGSEFDTNFDAGVDADENSDPKKYIQQLTGKLSQTLMKYNSEQQQPDSELCKYVAGMILKQATDGLNGKDKDEIIDKMNSNGNDSPDEENDFEMEDMPDNKEQPMMESLNKKSIVNEIFQELIQKKDNQNNGIMDKEIKDYGYKTKAFRAPSMD